MKKIFYFLAISFAIILTSCSDSKSSSSEPLEGFSEREVLAQYIPENVFYAIRINSKSCTEKSGFEVKDGRIVIPEELAKLSNQKLDQFSIPSDLSQDMYVIGNDYFEAGLIFKVKDFDKLKNTNFNIKEITEKDDFKFADIDNDQFIIGNDDVAIYVSKHRSTEKDSAIIKAKEILNTRGDGKGAASELKGDDDIAFFLDFNKGAKFDPVFTQLKTFVSSATFTMNFGKDNISTKYKANINKQNPYVKKISEFITECDPDKLKYFPANSNLILGLGINGKAIKESGILEMAMMANPDLASMNIQEIVELINGNVMIGANVTPNPMQSQVVMTINSLDPKKLLNLLASADDDIFIKNGDKYQISLLPGATASAENGFVLISNAGKDINSTLAGNKRISDVFDGNIMGAYLKDSFINSTSDLFFQILQIETINEGCNPPSGSNFDVSFNIKSLDAGELIIRIPDCKEDNILKYFLKQ